MDATTYATTPPGLSPRRTATTKSLADGHTQGAALARRSATSIGKTSIKMPPSCAGICEDLRGSASDLVVAGRLGLNPGGCAFSNPKG